MSGQYKNILIIKPSALGDIVHTLPAFGALRSSFPEAKITWLVRREFALLLECVQGLDGLLIFDRKRLSAWWYSPGAFRQLRDFLRSLREGGYDLVIDFQGLLRTAIFARATGCRMRVGRSDAREGASLFYTHHIRPPQDKPHMADYSVEMVCAVGGNSTQTDSRFIAPPAAVDSLRQKLSNIGIDGKPLAVLMPSSAHTKKCWPVEQFAAIAVKISSHLNFAVVAVGTSGEKPVIDRLVQKASVPIFNLAGQTTLPELIALLDKTRLVVSNDTGPGHIAVACSIPTVIIYGNTNPLRVGPYGKTEQAVAIEPTSRGMAVHNPDAKYAITNITEDMVWKKILDIVESNAGSLK